MSLPTIDVVIPCHNAESYLPETLQSIARQTYQAARVFVVDDTSTDQSAALARSLDATVLTTGQNSGPSRARNLGVAASAADLIAFVDADDYWEADHLREIARLAEACPAASVYFTRVRKTDGVVAGAPLDAPPYATLDLRSKLFHTNTIPQSAVAVRRDAFLGVGGYDESLRYSEDYELWLRMSRNLRFACSHEITVSYRIHDQQATRHLEKMVAGSWLARRKELAWAKEHESERYVCQIDELLLDAWREDLDVAWHRRDRAHLDIVLRMADVVPNSGALHARWLRRRNTWWWLWEYGNRTLDTFPALRPALRGVSRAWRRPGPR